jgi:thiosulfate/3-mercaptopyruvate sulfurtransferase
MKKIKFGLSYFMISLFGISLAFAQSDIISADVFAELIKTNEDVVIVDANKSKDYMASHVKNAIHINHLDMYRDGEIAGMLMGPNDLADFFGKKGISVTTPVIIYDDGSQKYNSRVYWALKYLGAENVKITHRDMDAWNKANIMLTSNTTAEKPVIFTPNVDATLNVPMEYVKKYKDDQNTVLVDARTKAEYAGIVKSAGHIPGAISLNYETILDDDGAFLPKETLEKIFKEKEITPDKEIILYCKTSVRATPIFVALTNILAYNNVKVYDGAYNEWVANDTIVQ